MHFMQTDTLADETASYVIKEIKKSNYPNLLEATASYIYVVNKDVPISTYCEHKNIDECKDDIKDLLLYYVKLSYFNRKDKYLPKELTKVNHAEISDEFHCKATECVQFILNQAALLQVN